MSSTRDELKRWATRLRQQAGPDAIRAGQAVLARGIRGRAPSRLSGAIHVTPVRHSEHAVTGGVVLRAKRLGKAAQAVLATRRDAEKPAIDAMLDVLRRAL